MTTDNVVSLADRVATDDGSVAGVLAVCDELYATGRRDTPTGTIIARLDPMTQRDVWLEVRRTGIGSSDVAAILGLSKYRSELDVYMDKRGEAPDTDAGEAARWGNLLEDVVAREWALREGLAVRRVGTIARIGHRHMLCDLDRQVIGCPDHERCALEVKTRSAFVADRWRDGLPDDVEAQAMWQLAVTGIDAVHVAALIGGQRLTSTVLHRDEDYIADLEAVADTFWNTNVLPGVPPEISSLDLLVDMLKRAPVSKGTPVKVYGADAGRARELTRMIEAAKDAAADLEVFENELKALIGDEGTDLVVVDDATGEETPLWTWRPQNKPKRLDVAALEADTGVRLEDYKKPNGTTRVLRRVKPKEK